MKARRHLKVGDTIPTFWTRDIEGNQVDSTQLEGYTLIAFLRYAGCPFCNLAIYRLSHEHKKLKSKGCSVIAFVQSTEANIEKNILERHNPSPPFSIVADHDQDFYRMFGVTADAGKALRYTIKHKAHWIDAAFKKGFSQKNVDGSGAIVPAYFLVDASGIITVRDYAANFYDNDIFDEVYSHLK
jgi:peroxiredoxin